MRHLWLKISPGLSDASATSGLTLLSKPPVGRQMELAPALFPWIKRSDTFCLPAQRLQRPQRTEARACLSRCRMPNRSSQLVLPWEHFTDLN